MVLKSRSASPAFSSIGTETFGLLLSGVGNRLPYAEYLRVMAKHRIVWQLDSSCVPGRVAGDAALCRIASVVGHGAVDREVYPMVTGGGRSTVMLLEIADRLPKERRIYTSEVRVVASLALSKFSFCVITERLYRFFRGLAQ